MEEKYKVAELNNDKRAMEKISLLEQELSEKTGKKIVLVAFDRNT